MTARLSFTTCVALPLLLLPAAAAGQSVRGQVLDRGSASPVAGVVVYLLDGAGASVGRALTNESGEYRVSAASAGTYRLRTLRIGFRPVMSDPLELRAGQEITHDIEVGTIPVALDTIRVSGRNDCQVRPDSAALTFTIWEQVRTALTATQLTGGLRALGATVVMYQRTLDPNRGRVLTHSTSVKSGYTTRPWNAISADVLRRDGYVIMEADGSATYYAPDIGILVSDMFIEHHCFRVARRSDSTRIGIEFEPTRERRRVADIQGTLWLDRKTSELRLMEFRYANVTREQEVGRSGGDMEFVRLKNGAWVITRWNIRMPVLHSKPQPSTGMGSSGSTMLTRVVHVQVEGGELALLTRSRDTLWSRPSLALTGTILDSASGSRVAGARVDVRGTKLAGISDSAGRFRIEGLLPGQYVFDVATPSLRAAGVSYEVPVAFTDSAGGVTIRAPTADQFLGGRCNAARGIVAGRVFVPGDSTRAGRARVFLEWDEVGALGAGLRKHTRWVDATTDARGAFRICDVPINTALRVNAEVETLASPRAELRILPGTRLATIDLTVDAAAAGPAVLSGVVLSDVNAEPIADVEVVFPALSRNTFTDQRGAFRLGDIPAGKHAVELRRLGYKLVKDSIAFAANQAVERRMLLGRVIALDTVAVSEGAIASFEENRKLGQGRFITRAELAKQEGRKLSDVIASVPGAHIVAGHASHAWVASNRARRGVGGITIAGQAPIRLDESDMEQGARPVYCYAQVYINKSIVYHGYEVAPGALPERLFDINSISPGQIEAIEFYNSGAQLPLEYMGRSAANCGVLVIHTRRSLREPADSAKAKAPKPPA